MKISIEELKTLANRLLFDMNEEEYLTLQEEFETILTQMEVLGKIEGADQEEPMTFPFIYESIGLREDEQTETLDPSLVTKNAKEVLDNQIMVKKVI